AWFARRTRWARARTWPRTRARLERPSGARRVQVRGLGQAHAQRLPADAHLLQVLQQFRRHALGQVHQAEVVADVDAPDVARLELRFVRDRADDVARLHAVAMPDLDPVGDHAYLGAGTARCGSGGSRDLLAPRAWCHRRRARCLPRPQQQRRPPLHQPRPRRRGLDRRDVVLALVAFDQLAERGEFVALQYLVDAAEELRDPSLVDRLHGRQLHRLDRLPGGALDRAQHAALARGHEQDRLALAACAPGAPDAVHVALGVVG